MGYKVRLALFALLLINQRGYAQVQVGLGVIRGVVTDPSGAVVPGIEVTASIGPTTVRSSVSDGQGKYSIDGLNAGTYILSAAPPSFAPYSSKALALASGRTVTLDISLALRSQSERVNVEDQAEALLTTDPANNADATVLRKAEIEALPDDPDDLAADLQALAGPAAGPNGGQIYVDGFTGGRLPPKQSIREIRINQNPFAAQSDRPGQGRIEIFTKPGTDEYHGNLIFQFSDASFNSRNTFVATKPPYQRRQLEGEFSGPLNRKTPISTDFEYRTIDENAFINAVTLDRNLNAVSLTEALLTPIRNSEINFKLDRQLSTNHTITARYTFARDASDNQGVGGISLPERAYNVHDSEDTIQFVETGILNSRTVNETRFRFRRVIGEFPNHAAIGV